MTTERIADHVKFAYCVPNVSGGFRHFQEEIEYFGSRVWPRVREVEKSEQISIDSPALVTV